MVNSFMKTYSIPETLVLSIEPVVIVCASGERKQPDLIGPNATGDGSGAV